MTTDKNPADTVIEAAAKVIQLSDRWSTRGIARTLSDAGLLADPADRDEHGYKGTDADGSLVGKLLARAERAEVELDYYHARLDALLATMGETLEEGEKPGAYWAKWHMKHCVAAEAAQQLAAERDAAKEAAALAEKDRRAYHRDALATIKERDEWLTKFREAQAEIGQARQVCREVDGQRERAEAKLAQTEVALGDAMAAEVAELRAMRDRVRELADKYRKFSGFNITARGAEKQLRAALDGAGEQQ